MATQSQRDGEFRYVGIADIKTDEEFNPRSTIDGDGLAELTESVKRRGILQPLLVRSDGEGKPSLVAGHRRRRRPCRRARARAGVPDAGR